MTTSEKYSFSFTAASALINESLVIAEEYLRLGNWSDVQQSVKDSNLLNKVKQSTFKREFQEIKKRLSLLTEAQLRMLVEGSPDERRSMILLALLKTYSFFKDFVIEVMLTKYLTYDFILSDSDYLKFWNAKSILHKNLDNLKESTVRKVKLVVFKFLEQTGLIDSSQNMRIVKPFLSKECLDLIIRDKPHYLRGYLLSDNEISGYLIKTEERNVTK